MSTNQCYVCGSNDMSMQTLKAQSVDHELSLLICNACGHGVRSQPLDAGQTIAAQIESEVHRNIKPPNPVADRRFRRPILVLNQVLRTVREFGDGGRRALDIGCNNGAWLALLGDEWDKHGVEVSSEAAMIAEEHTSATIITGMIEDYKAELGSFDLITAFALIEHVTDPRAIVRWVHAHLKPVGVFVLMTGDRESDNAKNLRDDWHLYWSEDHVSFFSHRSLARLLDDEGFSVVRMEWRFSDPTCQSAPYRYTQKLKEVLGLINTPVHSNLYCYALPALHKDA